MAECSTELTCCGVVEVHDIRGEKPENIIMDTYHDWRDEFYEAAFVYFADIDKGGKRYTPTRPHVNYADEFVKFLRKHKLGKVHITQSKLNKSSDNHIRAYIWDVNRKSLHAYAKKQNWYKEPDEDRAGRDYW